MSDDKGGRRHLHVPHEPSGGPPTPFGQWERREPTGRPDTQDPKQSHAGNGTVNHGPEDQGPEGFDSDELALRHMLHQAVEEIEPRDGTLEHLRKAVPARRARKRQALVGVAAAALFIGTAVPALVHVSNATGSDANPSMAGNASQAQGGASQGKGPDGGESSSGGSAGRTEGQAKGDQKENGKGKDSGGGSATDPSTPSTAGVAACTAAQLGTANSVAAPDSTGAVYGTFTFSNISTADCAVGGPGTVTFTPAGAADGTKITTARHVAGDPAAGLPDPSLELTSLVLKPGESYAVKFAWVPAEACPPAGDNSGGSTGSTGSTDATPTPTPTPTQDATTTDGTTTGADGTTPQLLTAEGTADGSVVITDTAESGAVNSTTVTNACAGVVYWTGVLAGA
jgi:hypothetical protein